MRSDNNKKLHLWNKTAVKKNVFLEAKVCLKRFKVRDGKNSWHTFFIQVEVDACVEKKKTHVGVEALIQPSYSS